MTTLTTHTRTTIERGTIYTIGHAHPDAMARLDRLMRDRRAYLVDIRSQPRSHRNPQWNRAELVARYGRRYVWERRLATQTFPGSGAGHRAFRRAPGRHPGGRRTPVRRVLPGSPVRLHRRADLSPQPGRPAHPGCVARPEAWGGAPMTQDAYQRPRSWLTDTSTQQTGHNSSHLLKKKGR